jgi:hypothetical protein
MVFTPALLTRPSHFSPGHHPVSNFLDGSSHHLLVELAYNAGTINTGTLNIMDLFCIVAVDGGMVLVGSHLSEQPSDA